MTTKQALFVQEYRKDLLINRLICSKLQALKLIVRHLNLARVKWPEPSPYELAALAWVLTEPSFKSYSKAAARLLLGIYRPGWDKNLPVEIQPYLVQRNSPEVREWREAVFTRDGYACVRCESKEGLHAHHIAHWSWAPDLRISVDNGMTLCEACHKAEHAVNTPIRERNLVPAAV